MVSGTPNQGTASCKLLDQRQTTAQYPFYCRYIQIPVVTDVTFPQALCNEKKEARRVYTF
jgi:hypothetical protein